MTKIIQLRPFYELDHGGSMQKDIYPIKTHQNPLLVSPSMAKTHTKVLPMNFSNDAEV